MPHKDNLAAYNEWLADEGEPLDLDAIRFSAPFAIDSVRLVLTLSVWFCIRARLFASCRPIMQPAAAPRTPWCPAKWPAVPPTTAPLRQPFAFAGEATRAKATAAHPISVFIQVSDCIPGDNSFCP